MSKKLYEELHEQYLSEIMKIKECRKRRNELSAQLRENDPDVHYFTLYCRFREACYEEECLEDILIRAVDEAYLNQPFKAVRQAGRTAFWKLVHETLDK